MTSILSEQLNISLKDLSFDHNYKLIASVYCLAQFRQAVNTGQEITFEQVHKDFNSCFGIHERDQLPVRKFRLIYRQALQKLHKNV